MHYIYQGTVMLQNISILNQHCFLEEKKGNNINILSRATVIDNNNKVFLSSKSVY